WIKSDSGLIENEHGRIIEQRLRQANALAIAFREIPDQAALHLLYATEFHYLANFTGALSTRDPLHFADEAQIATDRHLPVQLHVLWQLSDALTYFERLRKDIVAGDHDTAATGRHKSRQDTHCGRFPGTVRSQEPQDLPLLNAEGEIPDGCHGTI